MSTGYVRSASPRIAYNRVRTLMTGSFLVLIQMLPVVWLARINKTEQTNNHHESLPRRRRSAFDGGMDTAPVRIL